MAVTVKDLWYSYPDQTCALNGIDLSISKGKKTAILGINGSGKSTLLYHFNGTFLPQKGSVKVLGIPLVASEVETIRKTVGFLFDMPDHQLFATSVKRDVAFGPRNHRYSKTEQEQAVVRAMSQVGITEFADKPPYNLSLGQKKRTAIAGILAVSPEVIVCDEPFSGLDRVAADQFQVVLDDWVKEGKTLIFSTHDLDLVYAWADQVILMHLGKVLAAGEVCSIMSDQQLMDTAELRRPILAELFADRQEKPRTQKEAVELLRKER